MTSIPTSRTGPIGTTFSWTARGFTPYEHVAVYLTAPDGSVYGSQNQYSTDGEGNMISSVYLTSSPSLPTGVWAITLQGIASQISQTEHFSLTP